MSQEKFIVIEGLEGAGKSTAVNVIKEFLQSNGREDILQCREPGGTKLGETIRDLVKSNSYNEKIDSRTELLLMYASRIQLVENVIKPALDSGKSVICDRFYYSTYAYQGGGRGIDLGIIDSIHSASLGDFKPDLTIYMDIDPKIGLKRAAVRGELDRFEQEKIDFFNKTRDMYLKMAAESDEIKTVDASLSIEEVAEQVRKILNESGI
ncbi:MAG: dTMP kinase [Lentisphaeraceae bacterium]|nr:dTMP kinase [Lentisphaeraceae bacterium]